MVRTGTAAVLTAHQDRVGDGPQEWSISDAGWLADLAVASPHPRLHSRLLVSQDIGVAGSLSVFTAGYDPDGALASLTYPNGLTATRSYDEAGELTDLDYALGGTDWMDFGQDFTAQGQIADRSSPASAQTFSYDGSGRLTRVQDSVPDPVTDTVECTTRVYSFNNDSDRTALAAYPDGGTDPDTGDCTTATTPSTPSYSYDAADRLTSDTAGSWVCCTIR